MSDKAAEAEALADYDNEIRPMLTGDEDRLRKIEAAATELLTHWHEIPASHRDWVEEADERVRDLIDHLAAVVGGLA